MELLCKLLINLVRAHAAVCTLLYVRELPLTIVFKMVFLQTFTTTASEFPFLVMNERVEAWVERWQRVHALVRPDDVVVSVLLPGALVSGHLADDGGHDDGGDGGGVRVKLDRERTSAGNSTTVHGF